MANKTLAISNLFNPVSQKVIIQRILLESGAAYESKFTKDPHFVMPDEFQNAPKVLTEAQQSMLEKQMFVSLTLSIQGFKKRNLKNDPLRNIFDNLDMMSMYNVTIYEITKAKLDQIHTAVATGMGNVGNSPTIQDVYQFISGPDTTGKTFNLLEEITSATNSSEADLSRFESRTANGSTVYDFPIRVEPYGYLSKNLEFLAYMVVVEIDSSLLIEHIKTTIGGHSDFELPNDVTEYLENFNSDISNKNISLDVVFNKSGLNNYGSLLQRTDNKQFWFGSYHQMSDGTLMTGNKHNDLSMDAKDRNVILSSVLLPNTKIVDLRDDEEIEKVFLKELYEIESINTLIRSGQRNKQLKIELPEKFSDSYMSKESSGTHSYLFRLDKIKILLSNSLLGGIAQNLKKGLSGTSGQGAGNKARKIINNVLDNTSTKYLKIFRKRIQVDKFGFNRVGTLSPNQESFMYTILDADIENSYSDDISKEIASYSLGKASGVYKLENFNFLSSTKEKQYLFFSFKDPELAAIKEGNYAYSYELVAEDGILKTLTEKLQQLMYSQNNVMAYAKLVNSNLKKYYNENLDIFRSKVILEDPDLMDIGNYLDNTLKHMADIIELFDLTKNTDPFVDKLYRISNPTSGNYQGLLKFIAISETFISKIQKISGVYTGLETHLDFSVSTNQKVSNELRSTIKINETFPDIASLDQRGIGYEFVLTSLAKATADVANSVATQQIPAETFKNMAGSQFKKYFIEDDANTSLLGNKNSENKLRYFTPTQVHVLPNLYNITGPTVGALVGAGGPPDPSTADFNYYKPIILDILEYYFDKSNNSYSSEIRSNIRRLINIAGKYGFAVSDTLFEQIKSPDSSEGAFYSDSSESGKPQEQSSGTSNMSGLSFPPLGDPIAEYEDTNFSLEINLNIENFLFGMLSNIILGNEGHLPLKYEDLAQGDQSVGAGSTMSDLVGSYELPLPLQSLFIEYNIASTLIDLRKYMKKTNIPFDVIKEFPLSLSTFGWWWFNYSNIVEVRYIRRYENRSDNPIWEPLTTTAWNNTVGDGQRIICKLFRYENKNMGIINKNKFLDLPIFNEYFIIDPETLVMVKSEGPPEQNNNNPVKQQLDLVEAVFGQDAHRDLNTDSSARQNDLAEDLGSKKLVQLLVTEQLSNLDLRNSSLAVTGRGVSSVASTNDLNSNALTAVDTSTYTPPPPEYDDAGPGPGINPYKF
jgi:hypothetical protein